MRLRYRKITSNGSGCTICHPDDAGTHSTEEHDEDYVALSESCDQCGAESEEYCLPWCPEETEKWLNDSSPWFYLEDVTEIPIYVQLVKEMQYDLWKV